MKKYCILIISLLFLPGLFHPEQSASSTAPVTFSKELSGDQLYQKGIQYVQQEKYQEAIPYLEEAAKRRANFAEAYLQLGICYMNLSNTEKARQNLTFAEILAANETLKQQAVALKEKLQGTLGKQKKGSEETSISTRTKGEEGKENQANNQTLLDFGIKGSPANEGFLIREITGSSLAEKAGLRKGDRITGVGDETAGNLQKVASGLQHFKSANRAALIVVSSGASTRDIGWPPIEENAIADSELRQIEAYQAAGTKAQEAHRNKDAAETLAKILFLSMNYPYRGDVYLKLARIYIPMVTSSWEKRLPDFPAQKTWTQATLQQQQKILDEGIQTYKVGESYFTTANQCLTDAGTEMKRKGAKTLILNFLEEVKSQEDQLKAIKSQYAAIRNQEILTFSNYLNIAKATLTNRANASQNPAMNRRPNPGQERRLR